ncbi:low molecular weight phosphotyrosine protein phosphatase [Shewanella corallii]|uniref:Low molecular weight phosphotyrosine protein phosphatase n=1 Tax=Shewanella corallii TaxID=560080 RepID=A0ABT0N8N4_9GAMM|nr:low molecular weight protein-tyrosine-phosphatase [Shewanella corallii]MCL2914730.1 low molecular weight phosphotyrosine protein phosphatase [Shewanella corallii]
MTPSVLFVCMGNICRSPTAEAVCRKMATERGVDVRIDSAGTIAYHAGEKPDPRSQAAGEARGYDFSGIRARQVNDADFELFDLILAADNKNLQDLAQRCPSQYQSKLALMLAPCEGNETQVPDPYYGGEQGFEHVLDLLEEACGKWLDKLTAK